MTMHASVYGRLGGDPREITTTTGKAMAVGSIAVTLADRRGEARTQWLGVVAFGKLAELLLRHAKGEMVSVAGRVQVSSYTASSGETREELQVIADSLVSAKTARPGGGRRKAQKQPAGRTDRDQRPPYDGAPFNDEIPF
jgi:single-strand DNA-binding protein